MSHGPSAIARSFVACNGADLVSHFPQSSPHERLALEYRDGLATPRNLNIHLPKFVGDLNYLPPRLLDLLEIASYVYGADRNIPRGSKGDVEYHRWSREYHFAVRVRDHDFWQRPDVVASLDELLSFLSGNACYRFEFDGGHVTPQANLFDTEEFALTPNPDARVILYSGGLDSLAGVVEELDHSDRDLYLVSHRSGQPATSKTQVRLLEALSRPDPTRPHLRAAERLKHYRFGCSLRGGERAREETQRTRFFLYSTIAFVLASVLGLDAITVYENGITSLNFPKRQDLAQGRATRTTHPRTVAALNDFFSLVAGRSFRVDTPYFWDTKTDVLNRIAAQDREGLISSSVSCSKTFKVGGVGTHCGGCSQCVDRRFATWAAGVQDGVEGGIYATDFLTETVADGDMRTTIIDFVRQAKGFTDESIDAFYTNRASDLSDVYEYLGIADEEVAIERLWELCQRHGEQVRTAIVRMREAHDDPYTAPKLDSFLDMVRQREYLKEKDVTQDIATLPPAEVFFSYCHADETLRDELAKSLKLMERQGVISGWHDRQIGAGNEWEGQIDEHLNSAAVILLLVSSDFINSDYCYDVEMKRAMERHASGEARVIPVIVRDCDWTTSDFGKLQALPTDGKAVMSRNWHNADEAFTIVAKGIRAAVEAWRRR